MKNIYVKPGMAENIKELARVFGWMVGMGALMWGIGIAIVINL